jgi:chemotaxis protein methyltransferase CheR
MGASALPDSHCSQLSEVIAGAMGLHFPRERWGDLQRGLAGAADEFGFDDVAACADWLLSAPLARAQLHILAGHLTIGETYFFRGMKTFEVLAASVLPGLIHSRRGREQRLRIWSAGCCTGEEAYSLAILLRQILPDLADWRVTILATDINARFLRKAAAGSYGEWSFRDTPMGFKERYFNRSGDGRYDVRPEIKEMVTFAHLNLAEDVYPSLATDTNAMDLIMCRNVLMYFTPAQTRKVIGNLHYALLEGGCLSVSPSEASQAFFPQFVPLNFPGVILYQKSEAGVRSRSTVPSAPPGEAADFFAPAFEEPQPWAPLAPPPRPPELTPVRPQEQPAPVEPGLSPLAVAGLHYAQGRYAEAADTLVASRAGSPAGSAEFSLLARALANEGRLNDALAWCDRWIAADKLNPAGHYLRAVVLLERGDREEARGSLQRAVYLHPDFVLAHFALGNLARSNGKPGEADKHFGNALLLLARHQADDPLPEADGLTVGRLTETITALTALEATR